VVQLHRHLSLSLEVLSLLVSVSDSTSLDLVLKLEVLFVDSALFSENFFDVRVTHLLLVLEVLDA
jgi:hypothetical protein